jgi:hypothetical protein
MGEGWDAFRDRGNPWVSPNHSAALAWKDIEEYKKTTGYDLSNDPNGYIASRLDEIGGSVGMDSSGLGGGLLGTVERLSPRKYRTADEFIDAQRKSDYRGTHTAPLRSEGGEGAPLHDMSQMYPDDIYGPHAVRYYGDGSPMDTKSVRIIQQFRGKPESKITVYRAVPNESKITKIHAGDWVTINKDYAKLHGYGWDSKILSKEVKAKEIFTEANSVHEFGYNPSEGGILSNKELGEIWENAQK